MTFPRPAHGFEAVDQETNAQGLVDCLDRQSGEPFHQAVTRRVFALLAVPPAACILDVGCGTGGDARELARLVAPDGQVIGIDTSEVMLAAARGCAEDATLPLIFEWGDGSRLRFPDASFDGGYAIRTFQHVADPRSLTEAVSQRRHGLASFPVNLLLPCAS